MVQKNLLQALLHLQLNIFIHEGKSEEILALCFSSSIDGTSAVMVGSIAAALALLSSFAPIFNSHSTFRIVKKLLQIKLVELG